MDYKQYLENRNLSKNTIESYLINYRKWKGFVGKSKPTKTMVARFLKDYGNNHKPSSVHQMYATLLSIFRYERRFNLIAECSDIRLPRSQDHLKETINLDTFDEVKNKIKFANWVELRNWIIFSFLFCTGIRTSELSQIKKNKICNSSIEIIGKANKSRVIFIPSYLNELLSKWDENQIDIKKNGTELKRKQIYVIIKMISIKYFGMEISPHGLRRSYATNLLRSNINLEIVRRILGHSNINTTSRYLQYTDKEILNIVKEIF